MLMTHFVRYNEQHRCLRHGDVLSLTLTMVNLYFNDKFDSFCHQHPLAFDISVRRSVTIIAPPTSLCWICNKYRVTDIMESSTSITSFNITVMLVTLKSNISLHINHVFHWYVQIIRSKTKNPVQSFVKGFTLCLIKL